MQSNVEQQVKGIMATLFKVPSSSVGPDTSVDTVDSWDSLNHMKLVLALEETFGVEFSETEVTELLSLDLVLMTLREKGLT